MLKKTIFVIDDDPDIVEFLSYNLEKEGYQIMKAPSGLEALWQITADPLPDLILLDLMMPSPNGYELCKYLKASDDFRDIPVIIISAKGTEEDIQKGLLIGADAYLPKPFKVSSLLELLRHLGSKVENKVKRHAEVTSVSSYRHGRGRKAAARQG
jgi:DNA-binding response OmpR family regulator